MSEQLRDLEFSESVVTYLQQTAAFTLALNRWVGSLPPDSDVPTRHAALLDAVILRWAEVEEADESERSAQATIVGAAAETLMYIARKLNVEPPGDDDDDDY